MLLDSSLRIFLELATLGFATGMAFQSSVMVQYPSSTIACSAFSVVQLRKYFFVVPPASFVVIRTLIANADDPYMSGARTFVSAGR